MKITIPLIKIPKQKYILGKVGLKGTIKDIVFLGTTQKMFIKNPIFPKNPIDRKYKNRICCFYKGFNFVIHMDYIVQTIL